MISVIVWLTDAQGPGTIAGVTDSKAKALRDAETMLSEGTAVSVRVEMAHANVGGLWIKSGYQRDGSGWAGVRAADGSVKWTRFHRPALAAS